MTDADLLYHLDRLQRATTDGEWRLVEGNLKYLSPSPERDVLLRAALATRKRRAQAKSGNPLRTEGQSQTG